MGEHTEICQPPCGENGVCNVNTGYCDCSPGFTGPSCDDDVRECDTDNGGCNHICTDFPGGYNCSCRSGFRTDGNTCTDVDECAGDSGCNQICVNTPGSYYCNCERGYLLIDGSQCEDVNECDLLSLCDQECVNTEGTFHCACREGYQLFRSYFCIDIDECSEGIDTCDSTGPTPAECINTEGGYRCSCDDHIGYLLNSSLNTCEDVNECEEGIHLCIEVAKCENAPGSYICTCPGGYALQDDDLSCVDIDECGMMNGGCQHTCTNTLGSFRCECEQGYELSDDNLNCEAQSCAPVLEAPPNGEMKCDSQTVGGTCAFSCDEGYTLRRGASRTCLPSLQWAEPPAICDPPMCPELVPPENGFVLFPCTREEGDVCRVVCAHGYQVVGPSNQTCKKNETGSLLWSEAPECMESSPCSPNPCLNGGYCIEDDTGFSCVCNGTATGFTGPTCRAVIIHFPPIPPVTDGLTFPITLFTDVNVTFKERVTVKTRNPRLSAVIDVRDGRRNSVNANGRIGTVRVILPDSTAEVVYVPQERTVFIVGRSEQERISYFEQFNLTRGLLKPTCCTSDKTLSCPRNKTVAEVTLKSPCKWSTTGQGVTRSFGAVFAEGVNITLPTSISGLRYKPDLSRNNYLATPRECGQCDGCENDTDNQCCCYTHTAQDTIEFHQARALGFTYINRIQPLLPSWLELFVDLQKALESSPMTEIDVFAPMTPPNQPVSSIEGCSELTGLVGSRFSVLRYDKTLSAIIHGERYDYRETGDSEADVMCFAVDLCHESKSPVHIQISQPVNDILVSQYLHHFTADRNWDIQLNTVSFFSHPITLTADTTFWNGVELISLPVIEADVSMSANVEATFNGGDLTLYIEFTVIVSCNSRERKGLLVGDIILGVDSTISGAQQHFQISTYDRTTEAYVNIEDGGDPCNSKNSGLSFTASYQPQPGELFFTRLLPFTEITQSCNFHAFTPLTSDYRALGLSLYTECPLLALGQLIIPEMAHTVTFIGSENPTCFTSNFIGVTDPALVIESDLRVNNQLLLGNMIELQASPNGPDVVTVFGRGGSSGLVSRFSSVQVTIFGGMFESEAVIRNDQLRVSTSDGRVFGFPAEMTITAPSNETNWHNLTLTVEGSLLSDTEKSFTRKLTAEVVNKLRMLAETANSRREVAKRSLDQSKERLNDIEDQYNQVLEKLSEILMKRDDASGRIGMAMGRLEEVEREFNASREELETLVDIDGLCVLEDCPDVCMAGEVCRNCTRPIFIEKTSKCPTTVKEVRSIRVPPFYVTRRTWVFMRECRLEDDRVCIEENCPVGVEKKCYGKCVPVRSVLPVFNWRMVEVDVPSFENCTISVLNYTVPSSCCETVTCAVRAPSAECTTNRSSCNAVRENAVKNTPNVTEEVRELFQQLLEARKNLSLAETAYRITGLNYERCEQRRDQLGMSIERLRDALNYSMTVYDRTIEDVGPLLNIYEDGKGTDYQDIFTISGITFNTKLINSPTSLVFNVAYQKMFDGIVEVHKQSSLYISTQIEEINLERFADAIIDSLFSEDSKRSTWLQRRLRRQTQADLTPRQIFDSRCAHVTNTLLFFSEIQARLAEVQEIIETSREGAGALSDTLSQQGPSEDEEFQAYLDLIRSYEELSMEAVVALEATIFSEWQASMELLYSQSGSVGEVECDGLADCLQTSTDQLFNLISLTPESQLSPEFLPLRERFPFAVEKLLELALLSNISIAEGLDRVQPIINITRAYATDNYWCNEPPVMITEPPPEVNISLGDTLQLSCEAASNLPLTYHWTRDGNVLPQYTAEELVIASVQRQDSANYTCFASNPVGTAESISTSVTVFELPEFFLLPESVVTYFGDGNGAWFACNASAWPYPGWRWYHRGTSAEGWTIIEGELTNELLVVDPQKEDEGMFVCEAFNYHGSIRSEPVALTLLPFTVSQHQFPLQFSVFSPNSSCSMEDLYDSLHSLLADTISEETAVIEDFNITEVDSETFEVSLSLVSTNITTRFLNLNTFAEIANMALPNARSLRKSIQLITDLLNEATNDLVCPGTNSSVVEDSLVVGKLRYLCPPGQRLNSDYLLCLSCERGQFSSETDRSRVVNGVGFSETVPVCEVCPLDSYSDSLGSPVCSQCPKYHTTSVTGATSVDDCLSQPLVLECEAMTTSDHIDIDCRTNRPPQTIYCSFSGGPKQLCSYPVAINRNVSPLGNHTLTVSVKDDEEFTAETTVPYFLEEDTKPTVPAAVPPLVVSFINDSPRVMGNSVKANILISRPVQSLICRLRGPNVTIEKDCSSGYVMFSGLSPGVYSLRVVATNRKPDKVFITIRFEITDDPDRCTLHLINEGVSVRGDSVRVEFTGRGPASDYLCSLDKTQPYQCSSPVEVSGLSPGKHVLKVVPTGCGRNRMNLKTAIIIE